MISAAWGVFIWREFAAAPPLAKRLLFWMFVLFLLGLTLIALAPLY
jgi:glucose uptake protein